jgi:hypothetical protein
MEPLVVAEESTNEDQKRSSKPGDPFVLRRKPGIESGVLLRKSNDVMDVTVAVRPWKDLLAEDAKFQMDSGPVRYDVVRFRFGRQK